LGPYPELVLQALQSNMKITSELFQESFYSIGGGLDIQPLLRFTHLTNAFINVNLDLPLEYVKDWYNKVFDACSDIEVLNFVELTDADEFDIFELPQDYQRHLLGEHFLTHQEYRDYSQAFRRMMNNRQFVLYWEIRRPSLNRILKFWFVTAEGLAMYSVMSRSGQIAPRIVATIQTNVLEQPDGILNRFYAKSTAKPQLWLRGFQPDESPVYAWRLNPTLNCIGLYPHRVQRYLFKWICGEWNLITEQRPERYCQAFTYKEVFERFSAMKFEDTPRHQILNKSFRANQLSHEIKNLLVTPIVPSNQIRNQFQNVDWVEIPLVSDMHRVYTAQEIANAIEAIATSKGLDTESVIHIIPMVFEDQGQPFFEAIKKFPQRTITYAPDLFDFVDLKVPKVD